MVVIVVEDKIMIIITLLSEKMEKLFMHRVRPQQV